MLKITCIEASNSMQTLKLEGKLLEPWIPELLGLCADTVAAPGQKCLDLSGLLYVDRAGARIIQDLIRQGYSISACSGFIAELLHLEMS